MSEAAEVLVARGGTPQGCITVPGDKSISHRAVMFGALAEGTTEVSGFLAGADCLATLEAFRAMGVSVEGPSEDRLTIHGVGLHGLQAPAAPLDVGNSGTSMRLLAGLLAGQAFASELTGDESLLRRPMGRVADPLNAMGARVAPQGEGGRPPLAITPAEILHGIDYELPVASAQVKSAVLLAGLYAEGRTCTTEPAPTRDHTERMLAAFGYALERPGERRACLSGGGCLTAGELAVPADLSSAAFFLVAAAMTPGAELTVEAVGVNPTRRGVLDILAAMGADLHEDNPRTLGGEPVADIRVRGGGLRGITIPEDLVPLAIDEFPALFVAAAAAEGVTELRGAAELRVKESDRIAVMAEGLQALGIAAEPLEDGIRIQGGLLRGGEVDARGDHRVAMAFAVASTLADGPVVVRDAANVATSFPGFVDTAARAGLTIESG
jgi:3-phosphoshikimate 1-carboxyvinyltransferase